MFTWLKNMFNKEVIETMKLLPKVVESDSPLNGNGLRHHHYNLAKAVSQMKAELEDQHMDLVTIKFMLGNDFIRTKKQLVKSQKLFESAMNNIKKAQQVLVDATRLL